MSASCGRQVVTVNDYLARRDSEWVGQVPRFLGLSVAVIQSGDDEEARRAAYRSDITYITNSELGFGACSLQRPALLSAMVNTSLQHLLQLQAVCARLKDLMFLPSETCGCDAYG